MEALSPKGESFRGRERPPSALVLGHPRQWKPRARTPQNQAAPEDGLSRQQLVVREESGKPENKIMAAVSEVESKLAAVKLEGVTFSDLYDAFETFERSLAPSAPPAGGAKAKKGAEKEKGGSKPEAKKGEKGAQEQQPKEGGKKGKKEKKEKKEKPAKAAAAPAVVDVSILDIRVGKIVQVEPHPEADGLYLEQIDVGEEKPRQVISGLRKFVAIADMLDREVIVILNLKPAKMRGIMSNGMVLCASNDDHTQVDPLRPPQGCAMGEKVTFDGFAGDPIDVINPKKKLLEKLFPDLKTDADGVPKYKHAAFTTTKGACTASLKSAWVK